MKSNQHFSILRNILYFSSSVVLFFLGVIVYGIILNIREITLAEAMMQKGITECNNVSIVVDKKRYRLELYADGNLIKDYKAVFGKNNGRTKKNGGDNITPIGKYKICKIDTSKKYYKLLKFNYPNKNDATEALKSKIITTAEFREIVESIAKTGCSSDNTKLSGNIGLQGIGVNNFIFKNLPFSFNWTNGSIAVSNEAIDEILSVIEIGTVVEVTN